VGSADKRLGTPRLVVGAYSASNQRRVSDTDGAFFVDSLVAQLRIDSLIAETLVVPDTYLFDGRFFAAVEPNDLTSRVGRGVSEKHLPIEVRTRGESSERRRLPNALRLLLVRSGADTLNGFPFNSIADPGSRMQLASELAATPAIVLERHFGSHEDRDIPRLLADFLKQRADPSVHEDLDRLLAGWERWIEAEQRGALQTVPWGRTFDIAQALRDRPLPPRLLRTAVGVSAHAHIAGGMLSRSKHRSDIAQYLRRVRDDYGLNRSAERSDERMDIDTLDAWYSVGRHVAVARQHDADVASSVEPGQLMTGYLDVAIDQLGAEQGVPDIVTPGEVLEGLAAMSPDDFGRFTYESREKLRAVWRNGSIEDVRRLLDDLEGRVRAQDTTPWRIEAVGALGIVAGATGATAAALTGAGSGVIASIVSTAFATVAAAEAAPQMAKVRRGRRAVRRAIQYLRSRTPR
jgi:hypothetical protein